MLLSTAGPKPVQQQGMTSIDTKLHIITIFYTLFTLSFCWTITCLIYQRLIQNPLLILCIIWYRHPRIVVDSGNFWTLKHLVARILDEELQPMALYLSPNCFHLMLWLCLIYDSWKYISVPIMQRKSDQ